jgi:hypothetical protein
VAERDDSADDDEVRREFGEVVNLSAGQLRDWLETEESKSVGQKSGGGESTGHESGRRIVAILKKKESEVDDDDVAHMRKVVAYVHRHLAQRPKGDVEHSNWRYSLKNWGHDPLA